LLIPIIFLLFKIRGVQKKLMFLPMLISQTLIYLAGAMWFCFAYSPETSFTEALLLCVVPFIIPDLIKAAIAVVISLRLPKFNL
ncbi:MAG: biotin transporter BioY, partial [Clostridia bacterium]|nr:biotin transporter BioY [Clostridia bacterium]